MLLPVYMVRILPRLVNMIVDEVNSDEDHEEEYRTEPWKPPDHPVVETEYVKRVRELVGKGENVLLVGEPGAGKSTTALAAVDSPYVVVLTFDKNLPVSSIRTVIKTLKQSGGLRSVLRADAILIGDALMLSDLRRIPIVDELTVLAAALGLTIINALLRTPVIAMLASDKSYYPLMRKLMEAAGYEVVEIEPDEEVIRTIMKAHGFDGEPTADNPRRALTEADD